MPALWPAAMSLGRRAWSSTWATVAVCPLGNTCTGVPGSTVPVATRPQNTRRPMDVSAEDENFSTHCTGKASGRSDSAGVAGRVSSRASRVGPV